MSLISQKPCGCNFGDAWMPCAPIVALPAIPREKCVIFSSLWSTFIARHFQPWTGSIYTWLTLPLLDPRKSGRVLIDHLMNLVTTALQWSYAQAEVDVRPQHLEAAAEHLSVRRDTIQVI